MKEILHRTDRYAFCILTPNKMIFIERDTALSKEEISERMEILRKACDMGDDLMAKEALRKVVPTYKTPEEMNQKMGA